MWIDVVGLFLLLSGFVIGLGAVTVIDIHGVLGMRSVYWTQTAVRVQKVTKPLIWVGITLCVIGGSIYYRFETLSGVVLYHTVAASLLVINGAFLSFVASPYLLLRERQGKSEELLERSWQVKIALSLLVSDFLWWSSLVGLALYLA